MEAKKIKKNKINLKVEKHKKNKIKAVKNKKVKTLDFKIRFNILTFITYLCRSCDISEAFFTTSCKWS